MKRKRRQKRNRRYSPAAMTYRVPARLSAPSVTIDRSLAWYAVTIRPRAERKAELRLREAGFVTFLPSEAATKRHRGGLVPVERVLGRYLFVGLNASAPPFGAVRDVEEVAGLVSVRGLPVRVPVAILQDFADGLAGRQVILGGGSFSRLMAIMAQADDARNRARGPFWSEAA
jgi:transcription antitermination factor NusG